MLVTLEGTVTLVSAMQPLNAPPPVSIRAGKRGHLAPHLRPVLERLELDVEAWVENVERYGGLFHRLAGKLKRLKELA